MVKIRKNVDNCIQDKLIFKAGRTLAQCERVTVGRLKVIQGTINLRDKKMNLTRWFF